MFRPIVCNVWIVVAAVVFYPIIIYGTSCRSAIDSLVRSCQWEVGVFAVSIRPCRPAAIVERHGAAIGGASVDIRIPVAVMVPGYHRCGYRRTSEDPGVCWNCQGLYSLSSVGFWQRNRCTLKVIAWRGHRWSVDHMFPQRQSFGRCACLYRKIRIIVLRLLQLSRCYLVCFFPVFASLGIRKSLDANIVMKYE